MLTKFKNEVEIIFHFASFKRGCWYTRTINPGFPHYWSASLDTVPVVCCAPQQNYRLARAFVRNVKNATLMGELNFQYN